MRFVSILVLCQVLLAACGQGEVSLSGREELALAVAAPFEAGPPPEAQAALTGIEMAVAEYNEGRTRYQVKILRVDTKGTPEGATEAANSAVNAERIIGVVGPFTASEVSAAGPILAGRQVPMMLPTVTDVSLSEQGWSSLRRLVANDRAEGAALGLEVVRRAETGNVMIYHDGSPPSAAFAQGVQQTLERLQVPIARSEQAGNVQTITAQVAQSSPSVIVFGGPADQAQGLVSALRSSGFRGSILLSSRARVQELAKQEVAKGVISSCVCADRNDPLLRPFVESFRERYSAGPQPFSAEGYEAALMILEAIQEVEPRPKDLTEFFRTSTEFLGVTKSYAFDSTGEPVSPPVWLYRADGRWKYQGRTEGAARPAGVERR